MPIWLLTLPNPQSVIFEDWEELNDNTSRR